MMRVKSFEKKAFVWIFKIVLILLNMLLLFLLLLGVIYNPSFLLNNILEINGIIAGFLTGLLMAIAGKILFLKSIRWRTSLDFLVGKVLNQRKLPVLLYLSLRAGFLEELYARGPVLLVKHEISSNLQLICIFSGITNVIWTVNHLSNRSRELDENFFEAFNNSFAHLFVVFLTGIVFSMLLLKFNSILPSIIAHTTTNFVFSLFYRHHLYHLSQKSQEE
ncbi:Abortive infection protein [Desulfofundulus kuznetsovii DSM 6115]|uniref:Abortive infection protein n=1 Tax=Desulfofundulus kuznetsovii (strain DSM 6115 / VKM B-1805 / 17) TaxID=760568 RepID=A0AAU8P951_DESK7|nr:Abortive infection protein [Desulfofundulus kuznetsovii DSM 6115]